jgi:hypothetical protein
MLGNYVATLAGAGATGGSGGILLANLTLFDFNGSSSLCAYQLTTAGDVNSIDTMFGLRDQGDWANPKSLAPGLYEVRVDLGTGSDSLTSGTVGSWEALTSTRTWELEQTTPGSTFAILLVQIRLSGTVLTSATVTLSADVFGI